MRLENLLQLRYRLVYLVISLVLYLLCINNIFYVIIVPFYGYYLWKNQRKLLKFILIILFLYIFRVFLFENKQINSNSEYEVEVVKNLLVSDYTTFTGKYENQAVKIYINEVIQLKPGNIIICNGELENPINNTAPNLFNYKNYLKSQNIKYILNLRNCKITDEKFNINILSYHVNLYIDENIEYSREYIKTFILADKTLFDDSIISKINKIGISHLFAVSGLHISLIVISLNMIFKKMKIRDFYIEIIICCFLSFYLLITSFAPSITRASLFFVFLLINKKVKLNLSSIDILSIIFILLILINPYYYFDVGFVLSFLVTFTILLCRNILRSRSKIEQLFLLSFFAFFVTLPIILNLNYQINILSLLFNVIFLFYVTYIILPLSYATFILPLLGKVNLQFTLLFEVFLNFTSKFEFMIIRLYFSHPIMIVIYYVILFFIFHSIDKKESFMKLLSILIFFILLIIFIPNVNFMQKVVFLDVNGDSTIIIDRFDQCNIIIDTGEEDKYDTLVNYLKTQNIKRIDYLIISHNHSDHYGEVSDVLNEFDVIQLVNRDSKQYFGKEINCGNIAFFLYSNETVHSNENENSIIMSLFISGKHYLFTGDIEEYRETQFNYNLDIDYLKVPHHGSITSSSIDFIKSLSPEEVFILVSRNNTHNHPSDIIINRYNDLGIKVHRTDLDGSIIISYVFGKEFKKTYAP